MISTFDRRFRILAARASAALFAGLLALGGHPGPAAVAAEPGPGEVMLFLGDDSSGPSRNWELPAGKPFLAVPYIGSDYAGRTAGILVGAEVGVVLFEGPFFQTVDDTCDYQLGSAARPELWWLSAKTRLLPAGADEGVVSADLGATPAASLIIYRRELGPPPGALLLEKRRYVNWDCQSPTKARAFKRLFVPVPHAPNTLGCFNLTAALGSPELGSVTLEFTAPSELALLLPGDAGGHYGAVEHRLTATLHDAENCEGASVTVAHPGSEARRFDLGGLGFDRKARSLQLSYDSGAYDDYLPPPGQRPETPVYEIVKTPAPTAETAAPEPTAAAPAASAAELSASLTTTLAEQEGAQPAAPEPTAEPDAPVSTSLSTTLAEQEGATQSTATQEAGAIQTGLLIPPAGVPKATAGSRTFQFPLLQGYRLDACKSGTKDCGEPAASAWCEGRGFQRAAKWKIDENVGALFPTLSIGDLRLCASFVCDSFEEITCAQ